MVILKKGGTSNAQNAQLLDIAKGRVSGNGKAD